MAFRGKALSLLNTHRGDARHATKRPTAGTNCPSEGAVRMKFVSLPPQSPPAGFGQPFRSNAASPVDVGALAGLVTGCSRHSQDRWLS